MKSDRRSPGFVTLTSLLLAALVLAGCGDDDGDGGGSATDTGGSSSPSTSTSAPSTPSTPSTEDAETDLEACDLLTPEQVAQAVGTAVQDGASSGGPVATGGTQSTCVWSVEGTVDAASITVYSEASAADSVRTSTSKPLPELGEDAFVGPLASVWAYAGEGSFTAQWYSIDGTPEDHLPAGIALGKLVLDAL